AWKREGLRHFPRRRAEALPSPPPPPPLFEREAKMSSSTTHLAPAFLPLAGLALALTAFSAPAQTVIPPSAANALGGAGAGFPFSYTGYVRYQQALDKSYLTPGLLYGVSFRSRSTTLSIPERQWQEMRVILADLTAATPAAM